MTVVERYLHRNPELLKSVWLEVSPARMIVMPVVLILVILLSTVMGTEGEVDVYRRTLGALKGFMAVVLLIYGSWQAAQSYLNEVNDNTWIFQRMSSITPWNMLIGKLIGGTLYAWYGGILAAIAYLVTAAGAPAASMDRVVISTPLLDVCAIFLTAFLAHAVSLLAAFQMAERNPIKSRLNSFFAIGVGGIFWFYFTAYYVPNMNDWWRMGYVASDIYLVSLVVFSVFAILGLHNRIKQELQHATLPWVLFLFLIFMALYVAGFGIREEDGLLQIFAVAIGLLGLSTLALAGAEATDLSRLRHLRMLAAEGRWRRFLELVPQWAVGGAIFSVFAVFGLFLQMTDANASAEILGRAGRFQFQPGKLWLLLLRDIGIVLWLSSALKRRHADLIICATLLILYVFLPLIFGSLQWDAAMASLLPVQTGEVSLVMTYGLVVLQSGAVLFGLWSHARRKLTQVRN